MTEPKAAPGRLALGADTLEYLVGAVPGLVEEVGQGLVVEVEAHHDVEEHEDPGGCYEAELVGGYDWFSEGGTQFVLGGQWV